MEVAASPLSNRRIAVSPALRRALLVFAGIAAVGCALLAQHPADPTLPGAPLLGGLQSWLAQQGGIGTPGAPPSWVVIASLLAIVGGAIAIPTPLRAAIGQVQGEREITRRIAIGAALIGIPCLVAAAIWGREPYKTYHVFVNAASSWAALLWIAGIVAGVLYLWPRPIVLPRLAGVEWPRWMWLLLEGVALLVILDIAAGLRLWNLGSDPEGIWFDEVDFAHSAQRLFGMTFQPLGPGNVGHNPSLYFYVMATILKIGGSSITTIRLSSGLFGLVEVVAVYLLGRKAGGPALGLSAAALVAMGQWAIDFSRFGMSNIAAPALIALGFVPLAAAMIRPKACWFALSGLLLGLSLLTYAGGFLAGGGVAVVAVAIRLASSAQFRRLAWPGALLLPIGLVVGAAPLLLALLLDPDYTLAREQTVSLFNQYGGIGACLREAPNYLHRMLPGVSGIAATPCLDGLHSSITKHVLMFTVAGDSNGRHNLPGAPMLDAVTGACLLLGLGMCLRRLGNWFHLLLVLWLAASVLGGVLSLDWEAPQGARTVGATAPLALIAALPLAALALGAWRLAQQLLDRWLHAERKQGATDAWVLARSLLAVAVATVVTLVPLGVAFARNYDGYFVRHAHDIPSWNEMGGRQAVMGRAAAALAAQGYMVRISPSLAGDPALTFAAGEMGIPAFDPNVPVPLQVQPPGLALIMTVDDQDTLSFVRRSYPSAPVIPLTPNFASSDPQAYAVLIRQQDIAQNLGVVVQFGAGAGSTMRSHVQGFVAWPDGSGPSTVATIRGTLLIPQNLMWQPMAVRVAGAIKATLTVDGQQWRNGDAGTGTIRLGSGNHKIEVKAQGKASPTLGLEWTAGTGSGIGAGEMLPWTPIPSLALAAPTLPSGGLLGLYYQATDLSGPVALARVDQQVNTYFQNPPPNTQFPFSARWQGILRADTAGTYGFKLDSSGPANLFIDGRQVLSGAADGGQVTFVQLSIGPHQVRIDYTGSGSYLHCYLSWQPPGQSGFVPVPPTVTEPAHG